MRMFVSRGLCNAFYCHTEVDYINDVSEEYDPRQFAAILLDDPTFAVGWRDPLPNLSEVDRYLPTLEEFISSVPAYL